MISIKSIKTALKFLPISKDIKKSIEESSNILIDFKEFLSKKYNLSDSETDTMMQNKISSLIKDSNDIDFISNNVYDYAVSEGYSKPTELKDSVLKLSELLKKFI